MNKFISQIVQELIELDPELAEKSDDLYQLVEKLIKARPKASLDENFRQKLANEIKARAIDLKSETESESSFASKLSSFFKTKKLVYTLAGAAFAVFILLPVLKPYLADEEEFVPLEEVSELAPVFTSRDDLEISALSPEVEEDVAKSEDFLFGEAKEINKKIALPEPVLSQAMPGSEADFLESSFDSSPEEFIAESNTLESVSLEKAAVDYDETRVLMGGACEYTEISGTAKIISIDKAAEENACAGAVELRFDFKPDDPKVEQIFVQSDYQKITVGAGMNPPLEWVKQQKIEVGSEIKCFKKEITVGTCAPVVFEFPELDYDAWEQSCWPDE